MTMAILSSKPMRYDTIRYDTMRVYYTKLKLHHDKNNSNNNDNSNSNSNSNSDSKNKSLQRKIIQELDIRHARTKRNIEKK